MSRAPIGAPALLPKAVTRVQEESRPARKPRKRLGVSGRWQKTCPNTEGAYVGTREDVYQLLEAKMLKYADYAEVPVIEVDEVVLFEPVPQQGVLRVEHVPAEMSELTGGVIYVRRPVVDMLYWAGQELKNLDRSLTLKVVYGFRALEVQTRLFEEAKASLAGQYPDEAELIEATHRHVAVPSVAGYPTGGAVAVEILRDEQPVDMGTPVMEADRDSFTFSPFVSPDAWAHRQLLRRAMMAAGFAPFDGEWWHFSYGDKEWARFYRQPGALYDQVAFADAQKVDPDADLAL